MGDLIALSCPGTPALSIPHLGIQFVDGTATAPHELLPKLAAYQLHHGVIIEGPDGAPGESTEEPASKPADVEGQPGDTPDPKRATSGAEPSARDAKPFG